MFSAIHRLVSVRAFLLLPLLLTIWPPLIHCRPTNGYTTDGTELVVVEEILRCTGQELHELCQNATDMAMTAREEQQQHSANVNNESVLKVADDLVILVKKSKEQQKKEHSYGIYQQSDSLTSAAARENILVAAAAAAPAIGDPSDSTAYGSSYYLESHSNSDNDATGDDSATALAATNTDVDAVNAAAADEIIADGVISRDGSLAVPHPLPPIDMSDFVTLIPTAEVKAIAANYYDKDPEVRRAFAYLNSCDFVALRHYIKSLPEIAAFLHYLSDSGLNIMKYLQMAANWIAVQRRRQIDETIGEFTSNTDFNNAYTEVGLVNEVSKLECIATTGEKSAPTPAPILQISPLTTTTTGLYKTKPIQLIESSTSTAQLDEKSVTPKQQQTEELSGLHGLVDNILEILPQDQILAMFFDKLESNENFPKLVSNIQSPAFAQILRGMEESRALKNFVFTLHNNGIYITRILDSLKAYFFLGGFS